MCVPMHQDICISILFHASRLGLGSGPHVMVQEYGLVPVIKFSPSGGNALSGVVQARGCPGVGGNVLHLVYTAPAIHAVNRLS